MSLSKLQMAVAGASLLGAGALALVLSSKHIHKPRQRLLPSTPSADGFTMPAEWDEHQRCLILWPYNLINWRDGAQPAQAAFAAVARAIAQFEHVTVLVPAQYYTKALPQLEHENITVVEMSSDDSWIRDTGPTFVVRDTFPWVRELRAVDWEFNAYGGLDGGCYDSWDQDELIALKCTELIGCSRYKCPIILEGGSIHTDGQGTCLTTEECLLNKNRNPSLTKQDIEEYLKNYMGVKKVIWLKRGLFKDDDTNGHVDNIACFFKPGHVLLSWSDMIDDPQAEISRECLDILTNETDALGRKIHVTKLPCPRPMYRSLADLPHASSQVDSVDAPFRTEGERLAASYANFYIANGGVIVPAFGDPMDDVAAGILGKCFPSRRVVQVFTRDVLLGGGNIHCITQQVPRGVNA